MVTKSLINQIKQLKQKKYRQKMGLFVAEGEKLVGELFESNFEIFQVLTTENTPRFSAYFISKIEMKKLTHFKTASNYLAVFVIPKFIFHNGTILNSVIALDGIADPGNLGTIIRTCDWFGIKHIACSEDTVDCFNPKVVQASMGSIARVKCHYLDLTKFLKASNKQLLACSLGGKTIYNFSFDEKSILIFGNESKGISSSILEYANEIISVPKNQKNNIIDSLNVSSSLAIILGERFRQIQ